MSWQIKMTNFLVTGFIPIHQALMLISGVLQSESKWIRRAYFKDVAYLADEFLFSKVKTSKLRKIFLSQFPAVNTVLTLPDTIYGMKQVPGIFKEILANLFYDKLVAHVVVLCIVAHVVVLCIVGSTDSILMPSGPTSRSYPYSAGSSPQVSGVWTSRRRPGRRRMIAGDR